MMKRWLFTLLLLPLTVLAQADGDEALLTGAELLANCQPDAGASAPTSYCMQFVSGLVQTLASLQEMAPADERLFCVDPETQALADVTGQVSEWLQAHPERLDEPAFLLVSEALRDNYPCSDIPEST
ncbi:Rap1a/Tai family immunity protein [Methylohalomonas lacus]|nr:Rap1a/Tai family immunity protein [Methylohalomonas lacus]